MLYGRCIIHVKCALVCVCVCLCSFPTLCDWFWQSAIVIHSLQLSELTQLESALSFPTALIWTVKWQLTPPPHIPNSPTPHTVSSWGADIYVGAADIAVLVLMPLYNHSFSQIVRDSQISFFALSSYTVTPKEVRPVLLFSLFASRFLSTSARNIGFHPRRATIPTSPVKALAANWKKSATILMT